MANPTQELQQMANQLSYVARDIRDEIGHGAAQDEIVKQVQHAERWMRIAAGDLRAYRKGQTEATNA